MEAETTESSSFDIYKWVQWGHNNRKPLLIGVGIVAAIGVVMGVVSWKKGQDEANANEKLFTYAPVITVHAVEGGAVFQRIATEYPDTSAGEQAQMLAGRTFFDDGKFADAQKAFAKFISDHPQSSLVPQASIGVAACLEAQGQNNDAINKYQEVLNHFPQATEITSPAKLTLGRLNEEINKPDQALKYYEDLAKSMNQNDPFAAEARERQVMILSRHPELMKASAPAPAASMQPTMKVTPAPTAAKPASGAVVAPKAK